MRLEREQVDLLKTFDRHLADVESHLAQNKTVSAERAYRCFFETYDEPEDKRHQQRQCLKPKYSDSFVADTERKMHEKKKTFKWLVEQIANFEKKIELCRKEIVNHRKDNPRLTNWC